MSYAMRRGMVAALEPSPGMLVATVDDYLSPAEDLGGRKPALDLGHLLVTEEREPATAVRESAGHLGTVTVEDMRRSEHIRLPFGQGATDMPAVLDALKEIGFGGLACVELSRARDRADLTMPQADSFLRLCRENLRAEAGLTPEPEAEKA